MKWEDNMVNVVLLPTSRDFDSIRDALIWMEEDESFDCVDNLRYANLNNERELVDYEQQYLSGCCGSYDAIVRIDKKLYIIGCNYGH